LYDTKILKSTEFEIPIISVGNITVGGTGKTPHIQYLINFLSRTQQVAVLSRGYKRKTKGFVLADENSTAFDIGDEPKQIKQRFPNVVVATEKNRIKGVNILLKKIKKLDVILLDDAFQHRKIKPDLSILLIDYNRPMYEDSMLPYGELRESEAEKRRANIIIITKTPPDIKPIEQRIIYKNTKLFPYQTIYFSSLIYKNLQAVFFNLKQIKLEELPQKATTILLVTGIAKSQPLVDFLQAKVGNIVHLEFADHHFFKSGDIDKIATQYKAIEAKNKIIVTTEKDAIRLQILEEKQKTKLSDLPLYYLPIELEFLHDDKQLFENQIIDYIFKNKSVHSLQRKRELNFNTFSRKRDN